MNKNFMTALALTIVAFFVSTEIAKAADISFSGHIRTRWEVNEQGNNGGNGAGNNAFTNQADDFINSSVRLAATANLNDKTSAFIQMQSTRTWGENVTGGVGGQNAGSGNASATVNDGDASVGVHQAYFTMKNFANLPLAMDAKVGRQEIILDGHRLFGNTIWTMGMQSHDAVRLTHAHDNMTLNLGYILAQEGGRIDDTGDTRDRDVYLAHLNVKGILGGQFSGYFVYDDGTGAATAGLLGDDEVITFGGRQAGKMGGLDYRAEYYHQLGSADLVSDIAGTSALNIDRDAYMFGLRVGKKFDNVAMKPSLTLWYDYLSGTDDKAQRDGEWNSFNTVFDTGHKFYGLIDVFLGVGGGGGSGTQGLGLIDTAVKAKLTPMPGWTLKADYHWFQTAESISANTVTGNSGISDNGNDLGTELDLTLVTKYNANTKVMFGYSHYDASPAFQQLKSGSNPDGSDLYGSSNADWAYVMFDVRF